MLFYSEVYVKKAYKKDMFMMWTRRKNTTRGTMLDTRNAVGDALTRKKYMFIETSKPLKYKRTLKEINNNHH